jgi:hypothetical protein
LKAKWAHFVKEEKLNTSLCVFTNDFFNPFIESSNQFLQCLVYPLFLTSDDYFFELNSWPYTGDLTVLFDNFCRNYSMVQSPTTTSINSMLSQFTSSNSSASQSTNTNESSMKVKYLLYQIICEYHSSNQEYKKRELGLDIYKNYLEKNALAIVKTVFNIFSFHIRFKMK